MKHRHLIALLQEGYTTIQVVFNDDVRGRSKPYTYKAPLSAGVEVGDRVVVDSPSNGLVVVEVVGTDKAPRIDLDADFTYKWIVQKVELKAYEEQLEREAKAMDALQVEVGKLKDLEVSRCVKINGYIVDNARLAEEVVRLQAKIARMEQQVPVVEVQWAAGIPNGILDFISTDGYLPKLGDKLYALPGAQPQLNEIKIALQRALELGRREAWTGVRKHRSWEDQREEQQCWDKVWSLLGAKGESE